MPPFGSLMIRPLTLLAVLLLATPALTAAQNPPGPVPTPSSPAPPAATPAIEPGSTVQIEYTLTDGAGAVLDTNTGKTPLTYIQGEEQLITALEKQLAGMRPGEGKKVVLQPEDAYGLVDPAAQAEVSKEALPPGAPVVGAHLIARDATGKSRPVTVKQVRDKTVIIDFNHPLAGKTLVFDLKVLSVEPPGAPAPGPKHPGPGRQP